MAGGAAKIQHIIPNTTQHIDRCEFWRGGAWLPREDLQQLVLQRLTMKCTKEMLVFRASKV